MCADALIYNTIYYLDLVEEIVRKTLYSTAQSRIFKTIVTNINKTDKNKL